MTLSRSKSILTRSQSRNSSKTSELQNSSSVGSVTTAKGLFHNSSYMDFHVDFDGIHTPLTAKTGQLGYYGPAYTQEEKLLVDPLLKRNTWYKGYVQTVKVKIVFVFDPVVSNSDIHFNSGPTAFIDCSTAVSQLPPEARCDRSS